MSRASFILDTCAALWAVDDSLSEEASEAISKAYHDGDATFVSPITAWEIGMLASRGRFKSPYAPLKWFQKLLAIPSVSLADMPIEVLVESTSLPGTPPRDPADRIIIATAREFGFTLLTRDRVILDYAKDGHLLALAC